MHFSGTAALLVVFGVLLSGLEPAQGQDIRDDLFVTNGSVFATALSPSEDTLYVGGDFTYVGPSTGGCAVLDTTSGLALAGWPRVIGDGGGIRGWVHCTAPDGSGGWYVGGEFSSVGGVARNHLAHINPDFSVDSWNPNPDQPVRAIAVSGSTVYVGGQFTSIGGQSRNRIAALSASTGLASSWNPNADVDVLVLEVVGSTIYAGGYFLNIGGQARARVAALDATTGLATSWNPGPPFGFNSVWVGGVEVDGSTVYIAGGFSQMGGATRNNIAAVDVSSGSATSWNPNAGSDVYGVKAVGSTVYAWGNFTSIGGQPRNRIAALSAASGTATSWNPDANNLVWSVEVSGSRVYAGGQFTNIGGQARSYLAAIDAGSGVAQSWTGLGDNTVLTLTLSGSSLFAGGQFTTLGGVLRNRIAALDLSTGQATSWNPNAGAGVRAFAVSGNTVYVGGLFSTIGGQTRSGIAELSAATGLATSWNPGANNGVWALAVQGSTVYAGGDFSTLGGQTRNRIGALSASTGSATAWDPNANGVLRAVLVSDTTAYLGGAFTTVGGQTRNRIAAVSLNSGVPTSWNPDANASVFALALGNGVLYTGGSFTGIGTASPRNRLAALDRSTGVATSWDPNPDGTVLSLVAFNGKVIVGGSFANIGGAARSNLAAIEGASGLADSWNPSPGGTVRRLTLSGATLYAGGDFMAVGILPQARLAALTLPDSYFFVDATVHPLDWNALSSSWEDYDRDGDLDVYLSVRNGGGQLLRNDLPSPFFGVTAPPLNGGPSGSMADAAWADVDNDGDLDLFQAQEPVSDANGECRLVRQDAGGLFALVPGAGVTAYNAAQFPSETSRCAAWGDYDRDGRVDLAVTAWDAPSYLYRQQSNGTFTDVTPVSFGTVGYWESVAWVDMDGDGDDDLFASRGNNSTSKLYRNDSGTLVDVDAGILTTAGDHTGFAWGDYDNDGDLDVHLKATPTVDLLLRNDGGGVFADVTTAPMGAASDLSDSDWGDWDLDGDLDLLVSRWLLPGILYRNEGGGAFISLSVGDTGEPYTGGTWTDYDGDGDLDAFLAGYDGSQMFRNDLVTGNHWLQVRVDGSVSNGSGIGAWVRARTGSVTQTRPIMDGDSHGPLLAAFGLGTATTVDTLTVRWPSGRITTRTGLAADQLLTIQEAMVLRVPSPYATIQSAIDAALTGDTVLVAAGIYRGAGNKDLSFGGKNLLLCYEGMIPAYANGAPDVAGQVIIDCQGSGRGMFFNGSETTLAKVRGLTFVNGSATGGGGIRINSGSPRFEDCVIAGNVATGNSGGGGIYVQGGSPAFTRCTISGNRGGPGGGLFAGGTGSVAFTRCILWGNGPNQDWVQSSASFTCSSVEGVGAVFGGTVTYVSGNIFTNPRFCSPRSYWMAPILDGNYEVAGDSPALPANNACGQLMGAFGQGCAQPTAVWIADGDRTTWEDSANWSVGTPAPGADVLILDLTVTGEIVFNDLVTAAQSLHPASASGALLGPVILNAIASEETLRLAGGTLEISGSGTLDTLILETGSTLGGTGTVTTAYLEWRGGLMTDAGTTHVSEALRLTTNAVKSIRGGRDLENEGAWTWPGMGVLRHGDGALGTTLENLEDGTFTVTGARTIDYEPTWGAPATFVNEGTTSQTAESTLTVEAVTTNAGTLEVQAGTVDLTGGLANFSGTTLTGGRYEVTDTLRFPGADVETNAAAIVLISPGSRIVDEVQADALTGLSANTAGSELSLVNGRDLSVASLSNAGDITLGSGSDLTVTNVFVQTAGTTTMADTTSTVVADTVRVTGGSLSGAGSMTAPLFLNNASLRISNSLEVQGNYEQTASGELEIELGGYTPGTGFDVLQVSGTAQLGGRLKVDLIPPFDPVVSDAFGFLTAGTVSGTFSSLESFSMLSHANYGPSTATAVIDGKHSRFKGPGTSWFSAANWTNGLPTSAQDVLVDTTVVISGGTAVAREVRVIGGDGNLDVQNGTLSCDTLRVRSGGALSLNQVTSQAQAQTVRLEAGASFGWTKGRIVVNGGTFEKTDPDLTVGDSPDTSCLVLRVGAVAQVPGRLLVGRDLGDRGCVVVEGSTLAAGTIDVGTVGTGVLQVISGAVTSSRTTVGAHGALLGVGTLNGEVKNQGLVSPGAVPASQTSTAGIGTLHVGSYDQDPGGVLEIEVAGTGTGGWDSLVVSSQAQLEGTLRLVRNLALESLPDSAQVVRYGTRSGTFSPILIQKLSTSDAITVAPSYLASALRVALSGTLSQVAVPEPRIPVLFRVYPNFPNPFRAATTIQFDLPERALVRLRIFDIQGRLVRTVVDEPMEPGVHAREWRGEDEQGRRTASGVYFYRLEAGRDRQVRRMVKLL